MTPQEASVETRQICAIAPVIPVLVIDDADKAASLARALIAGGLPVLEVTLRTPAALDAIREMSAVKGAIVGAGTVLNAADVQAAKAAGARQIVTQRPHAGPLRDRIQAETSALEAAGVSLVMLRRDWDRAFHPFADKGFFKVKKKIPSVLDELGLR